MKLNYLYVHGVSAFLFGVAMLALPELGDTLILNDFVIGVSTIVLGGTTLLLTLFKWQKALKYIYFVHSGFLLGLCIVGLLSLIQGKPNLIWLFTGELFVLINLSIYRGDYIE